MYVPLPLPPPQTCYAKGVPAGPSEVLFMAMPDGGSDGSMTAALESDSERGVVVQTIGLAHTDGKATFSDNCSLFRVTVVIRDPMQAGRHDLCEACYKYVKRTEIFVWSADQHKFLQSGV